MSVSFSYDALPGRVVFGAGAARHALPDQMDHLGARNILLLATEHERPIAEQLAAPLGERVAGIFTGVRPHVPVDVAAAAVAAAKDIRADCVLAIGGGSTTGTAKAIALDLPLPIVVVPTTYAGSEMTPVWGLTDGEKKTTGRNPAVLPRVVVYDPELTFSLPPSLTATSGVNALAHCVEALWFPHIGPIPRLTAEEGVLALGRALPAAVRDGADVAARSGALYGAHLAGMAFAATGSGLHHKICHVLGGAFDLPHAEVHTAVLPHVVAFNEPAAVEASARIASALGARTAAEGIAGLIDRIGASTSLAALGMQTTQVERAVDLLMAKRYDENPRAVDETALRLILDGAYHGRRPGQG